MYHDANSSSILFSSIITSPFLLFSLKLLHLIPGRLKTKTKLIFKVTLKHKNTSLTNPNLQWFVLNKMYVPPPQ